MTRRIGWTVVTTSLGPLLVAASERGVCRVAFGAGEAELAALLARELPFASLERDGAGVGVFAEALARYVDGRAAELALPLDVAGSRFQQRVWAALRAIPRGEVRSYGAVARALGEPTAARAVARACATNPVAVAIPCHRVVASNGSLGGYHYGVARKRRLLAREGAPLADPPDPSARGDFRGRAARGSPCSRRPSSSPTSPAPTRSPQPASRSSSSSPVLQGVFYLTDLDALRSLAFGVGMACVAGLFVLAARA